MEEITATVLHTAPSDPLLSVVFTVIVDATPPVGTTIYVNCDATYANSLMVSLSLNASDPESGVVAMRFSNDGTNWSEWETFNMVKDWTLCSAGFQPADPEPDGPRTVWVDFNNGAGLTATASDDIILDMTPPAIPTGLGGFAGWKKVTLSWGWNVETDFRGYYVYRSANCQFAPDDSTRITPQWQPHTSNMYTDTGLEPGATYYYAVTALDLAWNESALSSVFTATVPTDTTPPVITILYPLHNDGTVNRFPTIRARIEDDLSGIESLGWPIGAAAGLRVILDGVDYTEQLQPCTPFDEPIPNVYLLTIPLVPLPGTALENGLTDGQHTLEIRLHDIAGNEGASTSVFQMQAVSVVVDVLATRWAALGWQPWPVEDDIETIRERLAYLCLQFINPDTAEPWANMEELLQAALGRTTWESPVSFLDKIVDIKKVLNMLRWRESYIWMGEHRRRSSWGPPVGEPPHIYNPFLYVEFVNKEIFPGDNVVAAWNRLKPKFLSGWRRDSEGSVGGPIGAYVSVVNSWADFFTWPFLQPDVQWATGQWAEDEDVCTAYTHDLAQGNMATLVFKNAYTSNKAQGLAEEDEATVAQPRSINVYTMNVSQPLSESMPENLWTGGAKDGEISLDLEPADAPPEQARTVFGPHVNLNNCGYTVFRFSVGGSAGPAILGGMPLGEGEAVPYEELGYRDEDETPFYRGAGSYFASLQGQLSMIYQPKGALRLPQVYANMSPEDETYTLKIDEIDCVAVEQPFEITATLRDGDGNLVPNENVSFEAVTPESRTPDKFSLLQVGGTTGKEGAMKGKVTVKAKGGPKVSKDAEDKARVVARCNPGGNPVEAEEEFLVNVLVQFVNPTSPSIRKQKDCDDFSFRREDQATNIFYDILPADLTPLSVKLIVKNHQTGVVLREYELPCAAGQNLLFEWWGKLPRGFPFFDWVYPDVATYAMELRVTLPGNVVLMSQQKQLITDLIFKYHPVIWTHSEEFCGPIDVSGMLGYNAVLEKKAFPESILVCPSPVSLSNLQQHDFPDHYLDLRDELQRNGTVGPVVYHLGIYDPKQTPDFVFLQYWFFMRSSEAAMPLRPIWHEGDWEMFQFVVKLNSEEAEHHKKFEPYGGTASQHYYGQTLKWAELPTDNPPTSQDQDYIEKLENRPVIYVAKGTHATYFRAGEFTVKSGPQPSAQFQYAPAEDGVYADHTRRDVAYEYDLVFVENDPIVNKWQGHWGEYNLMLGWPDSSSGPRSPYYRGTGLDPSLPTFIYIQRQPKAFFNQFLKTGQAYLKIGP